MAHMFSLCSPPSRLDLEQLASVGTEPLSVELEITMDKMLNGTKRIENIAGKFSVQWGIGSEVRSAFAQVLDVNVCTGV